MSYLNEPSNKSPSEINRNDIDEPSLKDIPKDTTNLSPDQPKNEISNPDVHQNEVLPNSSQLNEVANKETVIKSTDKNEKVVDMLEKMGGQMNELTNDVDFMF